MASVITVSIAFMVAGFTVEILPIRIAEGLRDGYVLAMVAVSVVFARVSRIGGLIRMIRGLDRPG